MNILRKAENKINELYIKMTTSATEGLKVMGESRKGRIASATLLTLGFAGCPVYATGVKDSINNSIEELIKLAQGVTIGFAALATAGLLLWGILSKKCMEMAWDQIKRIWIAAAAILLVGAIGTKFADIVGTGDYNID